MIRTLTLEAQALPMTQETMLTPAGVMDVEPFAAEVGSEAFWSIMEGAETPAEGQIGTTEALSDAEVESNFSEITDRLKETSELEPTANRGKGGQGGEWTTSRLRAGS